MLPILDKLTSVFKKSPKEEFFVVFLVESKFLKIAVWEKKTGKINILKIVKEEFSGSLEDLIETSDRAISKASYGIPTEKLSKVIFSVPAAWSQDGKIQSNYLKILKSVCVSLSLKPLGFVLTTEAIVKAMESSETLKINFLLFHIGEEILNLSFIDHGNVSETISSLRSENGLGEDLLELLSRFKSTNLPNKIVIFDGSEDLESLKQEILKAPLTQKEKRFLHFPSVEVLGENADISAVIHTVGAQMGGKIVSSEPKTEDQSEKLPPVEEKLETIEPEPAKEIPKPSHIIPNAKEVESLGFYTDIDLSEKPKKVIEEIKTEVEQETEKFNISPKKAILLILGVLLGIVFLIFAFWFLFGKADVTLNIKTKKFENDATILLTTSKSSNTNFITGKEIETTVEGEMKGSATGKKKTGDKAKGEVVIFNKNTDSEKVFPKGTMISDGSLKFVTDEDVTIASSSMQTEAGSETKIFGKASVKVTAEKFGNEYNIEDNKDWSVNDYAQSSFSAHNDRAFSGGTTKEIQVVSENDQLNLKNKLEKSLDQKAKLQLQEKINKEKEDILNIFTNKNVEEKKYSIDVDEEAKSFTLSMKTTYSTYSYQKSEAKKVIDKLLIGKIPAGLFINQNTVDLAMNKVKETTDGYNLDFTFSAIAIPKINSLELAEKIKSQPVGNLDKWLKTNDIVSYSLKIWPTLPILSGLMPPKASNIKINIKY